VCLVQFRYYRLMSYRFSALITKENGWYVARCPELNVTSQGRDVETARANLREAIELCLETWGVPEERPLDSESFWTTVEVSQ
jgi:predicted RNase H-like HicB family nuclease